MAGYWPSSFLRFNGKTNERTRPIFRHLDQAGLVKKGYLIYETDYALVRIKNDFFTLKAAGKKPNLFVAHETHESNLCFLCFDCLLPLFATPLPKLS